MLSRFKSRLRTFGRGTTYLRLWPNPGFSVRVLPQRWFHYCRCCGFTLLKPGESRRGPGRKTIPIRSK